MHCTRCNHDNPPGQKFCGECGAAMAAVCSSCKHANPPAQKFCGECGSPLTAPASAPATPQRYTPKHLADQILTSRAALEGERKQVTVLFADLKGSMELLADRDPEQARNILDPVLQLMMDAVHHYEGTVNQVMGDGIMALFGAPLAHEDHAVRACYTALRMQDNVKRYAAQLQRAGATPVAIRIGLNSGEVVVRSVGSDLRMDYTAVGQTTHLAARIEQLAQPGSILIGPDTLKLAEGYVQVHSLGEIAVKGLGEPIELYQLEGVSRARTRMEVAAMRGLTKFVGRDLELQLLRNVLGKAAQGHGQLVCVVGEPGVGKSRLAHEFIHSHRTQDWLVLQSTSVSYGKASAYAPLRDLLRVYLQLEERDDARRIRERLTGKLLTLDRQLEPLLEPLLSLLQSRTDDAAWQRLDPARKRLATLDACKRLLLREAQAQPLLLVFEDLHWIDPETQAFLDVLVESLSGARILLLTNYRPEYQHRWSGRSYHTQIRVDPLAGTGAEQMLDALLGGDPELLHLRRTLVANTSGNAFFLEESVRTLVELGMLTGERGAHRLAAPLTQVHVPGTVHAMLAARIDRLAPEAKALLQAAAVIGKDVPHVLLEAIAETAPDALHARLTDLQVGEYIYEVSVFPDLEYTFKHALTHEVAYSTVLTERKRELHARILAAMERLHAERISEHVEQLAQHALRAERWDKAAAYLRQVGERAYGRGATRIAADAFEKAVAAVEHLPAGEARSREAVDLHLYLRICWTGVGDFVRTFEHARVGERLARELGDPVRLGWAAGALSMACFSIGETEEAIRHAQQADAICASCSDPVLSLASGFYSGLVLTHAGEYTEAARALKRCVSRLESADRSRLSRRSDGIRLMYAQSTDFLEVVSRAYAAWSLSELGCLQDAIAVGQLAVSRAEAVDQTYPLGVACHLLGVACLIKGQHQKAIALLERCAQLARSSGNMYLLTHAGSRLGYAYRLAGRLGDAISVLEQAASRSEAGSNVAWLPLILAYAADAYSLAGRQDEALAMAQRAIELSRKFRMSGYEVWALYLSAGTRARADSGHDQAVALYEEALSLSRVRGMRPIEAHCLVELGALRRDRDQVRAAAEMYRAMGMDVGQADAEERLQAFS